jgi:hypothetical protein
MMDRLGATALKRQHDDSVAEKSDAVPESSAIPDSADAHSSKKAKFNGVKQSKSMARTMAISASKRRREKIGHQRATGGTKAIADNGDNEDAIMDDAPASDDSGPGESTPRAVTIHVPIVYASDPINNPVLRAITDPQIRQAYLQEVGGRTVHMKDPLEPASALPEPARYAMKAKLMDGFTNKMCVQGYIEHGGKVTEDDTKKAAKGVDKAYKSHVATWFTAQNIVLPWAARKNTDRKALAAQGLDKEHFPVFPPPGYVVTLVSTAQPAKPQPKKATPKQAGTHQTHVDGRSDGGNLEDGEEVVEAQQGES